MGACKHKNVVREAYLREGTWGEFKRCQDCQQPQPLGPSNDGGFVSYEVYAAEVADWYAASSGDGTKRKETVPFIAGLSGYEPKKGELESSSVLANLYNCGLLTQYIRDAQK